VAHFGAEYAEMPFIKKFVLQYPDVQFISISIETDKKLWKKALVKYDLLFQNSLLLSDVKKSSLLQHYQIKDIPRFLLFDEKGKCLTSYAPRPSDANFENYLKQFLIRR